jgi:hypothetical protein
VSTTLRDADRFYYGAGGFRQAPTGVPTAFESGLILCTNPSGFGFEQVLDAVALAAGAAGAVAAGAWGGVEPLSGCGVVANSFNASQYWPKAIGPSDEKIILVFWTKKYNNR